MRHGATAFEKHYSIRELSLKWGIGRETIRKVVESYPGVLRIKLGDRQRNTTYRVPETVARMLHDELTVIA